jgi:beta-glucanase (GH16 family)
MRLTPLIIAASVSGLLAFSLWAEPTPSAASRILLKHSSAPRALRVIGRTSTSVTVRWSISGGASVARFRVFRSGARVGTTKETSYVFLGLACAAHYSLAVQALDAAGKVSGRATLRASTRPCSPTVWKQVFYDDFVHRLDASRWGTYRGQPGGDPGGWYEPSHVVVKDGLLNLETYRDPRFGGKWVSGGLSSAPGLKQTYGRYEVRFRMDAGRGVGVALLLWPVADHWPPEIDFGEHGGETRAREHMTATLHYGSGNRQIQRTVHADFTHWQTLGVEWTPGKLVYTLNGRPWAAVTNSNVPGESMEMDLQAPAGTCGDLWAPCPNATTPAHVDMQVDSVVAYAYTGPRARS